LTAFFAQQRWLTAPLHHALMPPELLNPLLHWLGGTPCFRVYARGRREQSWRIVAVYASQRRNVESRFPVLRGALTTWAEDVIAIGWDFALELLDEQFDEPASPWHPVAVAAGRLNDPVRRQAAGADGSPTCSEIMAHECGHTWQAARLGAVYLPLVGSVTFFREGPHSWNRFENEASEEGLFGGIVNRSVCAELMRHFSD
jgi:hypothetical protein